MEGRHSVPSDRRKAFEELMRGYEFAKQLRQVINNNDNESATTIFAAQDLVKNVLKSFTNTLFLVNKGRTFESSHHVSSSKESPAKSEDSHESHKRSTIINKDRRGCYKRRRTAETWEEVLESPTNDGHQWRKYGQKPILNNKYLRCSHKLDQGCQATKQVQRIQEEPPLYKTTYCGQHTCTNLLINPETILDPSSPSDPSILLISFDNTFPTPTKQEWPLLSSSFPSPQSIIKNEEIFPSFSFDDCLLLSPEPALDISSIHVTLSSNLDFDHMYGSIEDDDAFQL
ncbi:hypothetical protein RIF29_18224 [Crotalaria pallida]|uniref:WRKY domain-containing protein n=1 Tax=Crotalaria pallida TaxID=3830 RepID=A0AAN9IG12_CROPI